LAQVKYTQDRTFTRGEVYMVNFPIEPQKGTEKSCLLNGPHRVVVLYDSSFPRKTVVVVPISSIINGKGNKKPLISTDVELKVSEYQNVSSTYNGTIQQDSFLMTNQVRPISRNYLNQLKGKILPKDMIKLDIQLINTLGLSDTVSRLVQAEINKLTQTGTEETE
jgi:mRNA-degrading endonuclease toxin of MazEF toxin-antitoxin module